MFSLIPYGKDENFLTNAFNDLENISKNFWGTHSIAPFKTDIKDMGKSYLLETDLPGLEKDNIKLTVNDNYLTIKCNKSENKDTKDLNGKYLKRERFCGNYSRSFDIKSINASEITAKYENGVLKVNLPKKEPEKSKITKQIQID